MARKLVFAAVALAAVACNSPVDAGILRGTVDCGRPTDVFQGSTSFSSTKVETTVRYSCMQGCVTSGSSSATCTRLGTWSNAPPTCRIIYTKKNDNTYRNNDKGYKLYSG